MSKVYEAWTAFDRLVLTANSSADRDRILNCARSVLFDHIARQARAELISKRLITRFRISVAEDQDRIQERHTLETLPADNLATILDRVVEALVALRTELACDSPGAALSLSREIQRLQLLTKFLQ